MKKPLRMTLATVSPDASMTVRERLTFKVEGRNILRGIIRVFPLGRRTETGRIQRAGFEVLSVTLDGAPV